MLPSWISACRRRQFGSLLSQLLSSTEIIGLGFRQLELGRPVRQI
jgi:hypothetical protein